MRQRKWFIYKVSYLDYEWMLFWWMDSRHLFCFPSRESKSSHSCWNIPSAIIGICFECIFQCSCVGTFIFNAVMLRGDGVHVKLDMGVVRSLVLGLLKGLTNHFWRSPPIPWLLSPYTCLYYCDSICSEAFCRAPANSGAIVLNFLFMSS